MKTFTIADILNQKIDSTLGHLIYLIRDGQLVFYIGQSKRDVITRFQEHMQKPSRLGKLIEINKPLSLAWSVDFYTLADCRPFIQQKTLFPMQNWEHFDMDIAESAMIRMLKPIVNRDFNPNPTPLPSKYRGRAILDDSQTFTFAESRPNDRIWLNKMSLAGWVYEYDRESKQTVWRHTSGVMLTEDKITPYQMNGDIPNIQK